MRILAFILGLIWRTIRKALALLLVPLTLGRGPDPDLAGARTVSSADSSLTQASANSNNGKSLGPARYLPAWGPRFPGSLIGSKLVQRWPDGRRGRATKMTAFVPVEQVVAFYRAAIAAAGLPDAPGSWPRGARFELGGGNGHQSNAVLVADGSWTDNSGPRYRVEITVIEALPVGWKKPRVPHG